MGSLPPGLDLSSFADPGDLTDCGFLLKKLKGEFFTDMLSFDDFAGMHDVA